VQRPGTPGGARLSTTHSRRRHTPAKKPPGTQPGGFFALAESCKSRWRLPYLLPPLAGVPAGVTPALAAAALDSGVGMGLVPVVPLVLLELDEPVELVSEEGVDGVEGVDEVDGVVAGVEGVAPVSSTFLPQAPSASKAAKATAVAAAGLNLDACMSVSFYE
jgi:hypothetical protein